jgi:hypothetical protein
VDRLGAFATDGVREEAKRAAARPNLLRLRSRIQGVAETLLAMDQQAWAEAAVRYKETSDGWRVTCENRALSADGTEGARRCGEFLEGAAVHLADLADAESASEATALARKTAAELISAASAWNESADRD